MKEKQKSAIGEKRAKEGKLNASLADTTTFIVFILLLFASSIFDSLLLKGLGTCQQGFPFVQYAATSLISEAGGRITQEFYPHFFALNLLVVYIIAVAISFLTKLVKR